MRRLNSSVLLLIGLVLSGALGCSSAKRRTQRRELDELERALSALSAAPDEDRGIRLKALSALPITDIEIKKLRELCADSYRTFGKAAAMLVQAKEKTRVIEQAIAEALRREANGETLHQNEKDELKAKSLEARASLDRVNASLDRADELIQNCDIQRRELRRELTSR